MPLTLEEKLKNLPTSPGVYLHKDEGGKIIYVGKAKNLRNRVRSYFQSGRGHDRKTRELVRRIRDLEFIVTDTEVEALVLESNLIKQHKPRYNVLLKDDKQYPHLKLTINEPFPRVMITRKIQRDGALYFGPFLPASLELVRRIRDLEFIVTDTEVEALVLESNLIKQHKPRYNVLLKDDKQYPHLKRTINEPFPRVMITRKIQRDGALYFGPFLPASLARRTIDLINRTFQLRTCDIEIDGRLPRPCLEYHIKRCLGPCVKDRKSV